MTLLAFIVGLLIGGAFGGLAMAMVAAGARGER